MASVKNEVDQAVQERRLRTVYEFLDGGNYKRAIQEVDRILKKQTDFRCAKALKGLALLRMGSIEECRQIIEPITAEYPTEDNTLQALTLCYRELHMPHKICALLENVSKALPTEEWLTQNFMAHVRISDYVKQYQIALNLYKLFPKSPYFGWAVMSRLAEVEFSTESNAQAISLPLATKMMTKYLEEKKIPTELELTLYILLLIRLGNYKRILEVLEEYELHSYGISRIVGFTYRIKVECLRNISDMDALATFIEGTLKKDPTQWKTMQDYVKLLGVHDTKRVKEFLDKNLTNGNQCERPFLLGPLYLYHELEEAGSKELFDPIPYFSKYIYYFGHALFFFGDLDRFLSAIKSREMKEKIAQTMRKSLNPEYNKSDDVQRELNYCRLHRFLNLEEGAAFYSVEVRVESYVNTYLRVREKQMEDGVSWPLKEGPQDNFINLVALTLAEKFWPTSSNWCWTCAEEIDEEISPGQVPATVKIIPCDESLSGNTNGTKGHDLVQLTNGMSFLEMENEKFFLPNKRDIAPLLTLSLLHYCLDKSPENSQTRLLLAKTYVRCGAIGAAGEMLQKLDVKHLMFYADSYLFIWKYTAHGQHDYGLKQLINLQKYFKSFEIEVTEHVLSSYKYGSWEKILEFLQFRYFLQRDHQVPLVWVEKALMEYYLEAPGDNFSNSSSPFMISIARKLDFDVDAECLKPFELLTDSRDFNLIETYRPKHPKMETWVKDSFEAEKKKFKIRSILLGLMNNFVLLIDDWNSFQDVEKRIKQIESLLEFLQPEFDADLSRFIMTDLIVNGMWSPRIAQYVKGPLKFLYHAFKFGVAVAKKEVKCDANEVTKKLKELVNGVFEDEKIRKFEEEACLLDVGDILESVNELAETLSLFCIIIDALYFIVNTSQQRIKRTKSKKKKGKSSNENNREDTQEIILPVEELNKLIKGTVEAFGRVEDFLRTFMGVISRNYPSSWGRMVSLLSSQFSNRLIENILPYSVPIVVAKLRSSYIHSMTGLTHLISVRVKYLEGIGQPLS